MDERNGIYHSLAVCNCIDLLNRNSIELKRLNLRWPLIPLKTCIDFLLKEGRYMLRLSFISFVVQRGDVLGECDRELAKSGWKNLAVF